MFRLLSCLYSPSRSPITGAPTPDLREHKEDVSCGVWISGLQSFLPGTHGTGMLMTTSLSSRLSSCSSYSMLTSQPLPLSEGQQFTAGGSAREIQPRARPHLRARQRLLVSGMRDSSVVCSLHFSTPTSLLRGKDFSGFFSPMTDSAVNSFLSTLGCVCEGRGKQVSRRSFLFISPQGGGGAGPPAAAVLCCRCC